MIFSMTVRLASIPYCDDQEDAEFGDDASKHGDEVAAKHNVTAGAVLELDNHAGQVVRICPQASLGAFCISIGAHLADSWAARSSKAG